MTKASSQAKSLADVAAFVNACNAARFPDSTPPFFKARQAEESGCVFTEFHENSPLPLSQSDIDRLAEEWQHRRKVFPKQTYHE